MTIQILNGDVHVIVRILGLRSMAHFMVQEVGCFKFRINYGHVARVVVESYKSIAEIHDFMLQSFKVLAFK
jgi:hypothetical protein